MCGGTLHRRHSLGRKIGLSPRVRGNPSRAVPAKGIRGSIPACAGEPSPPIGQQSTVEVYPRVCGGTGNAPGQHHPEQGLSPRVRGNLGERHFDADHRGSIPACAGEPSSSMPPRANVAVYPRVCGGTWPAPFSRRVRPGLSPRVRGNPRQSRWWTRCLRSIPACAGEPSQSWAVAPVHRVYPRVCGGTRQSTLQCQLLPGLSPRVRGNPPNPTPTECCRRSIPACAGEPFRWCGIAL